MSSDHGSKLEAAHAYRSRGWRVIPLHRVGPDGLTCSCSKGRNCASKGKHPISTSWQNTDPLSAADIQALWDTGRPPNVGIATGDPSGFWVLDIDPEKGGLEAWREIKADREVPRTYAVRTGSGGWHFYFAMPSFAVTNSPAAFKGTGIDIRGTGGQVVAAPSVSDKGAYVAYDAPVAEAPDWLLDLVRPQTPDGPVVTSSDVPDRSNLSVEERARLDQYTDRAVRGNLDRLLLLAKAGWEGEPWNNTTYEVACALLEIANSGWNAYSQSDAYTDLFAHAPRDPEFDDETVNKIFQSALTKVGDKARPMPEGRPREDFDFMTAPGVRRDPRLDPKPGGGEPTTPAVGDPVGPELFFNKSELQVDVLGDAVIAEGPIAYGRNNDWWTYEGGVWKHNQKAVQHRCVDLLGNKYRNAHWQNVEPVVARKTPYYLEGLPHEEFINFRNGMLRWRDGELLEHDPAYLSTVQLSIDWEPEAACPTFDAWLDQVLHPDYQALCWQMLGYLLMPGNPLQKAFLLYGTGGNGKGTLIRVIENVLGQGNYASESLDDLNSNRFSAFNLFGRIANIAGDIDGTYQESTANFKKLTGEDSYGAERKFGDRFTFQSWAVPVFSANKIPGSADVSEGYLRRWVILHFDRTFRDPIPGLSDKLTVETPGIAAKAIQALRVLMTRNKFVLQGEAQRGFDMFAETIDQIRQWLKSGVNPAPHHHEPCNALYQAYSAWADRQNLGKLKRTEFCHRLEALGHKHEDQGIQGHVGLRPDTHNAQQAHAAGFWQGVN